jgi:hypothetical protein
MKTRTYAVAIAFATVCSAIALRPAEADSGSIGRALNDNAGRQKLGEIAARLRAAGHSDPRINVQTGTCADGLPTCYDGPSNTITIAGDPTKYLYKTIPQPGQPPVFPYSYDRAIYREIQKAYLWWVEEKRDGVDTAAYDQANILPRENEHFWQLRREPYRLCGHSLSECMEKKPE